MANSETKIVITAQDATKGAFDSVKSNLGALKSSLSGLSLGSLGAVGIGGFTAADFIAKTKATLDSAEAINKLSQKTGIATDTLSGFRVAAELADVSQETLGTGLKKLAVNMAAAAGGGKEQADVFEAMGVKVKDATGKLRATDEVLRDISDKFAGYKDGPAKAALAVELFGKSGDALIPLLNNLRETETEAKKLGAVFGPEFAARAEEFNDNLKRMGIAAEGAKISFISPFLEGLKEITQEMVIQTEAGNRWGAMILGYAQATPLMDTTKLKYQKELAGIPDQVAGIEANIDRLQKKFGNHPTNVTTIAGLRGQITALNERGKNVAAYLNDYETDPAKKDNKDKRDAPIVPKGAGEGAEKIKHESDAIWKHLQEGEERGLQEMADAWKEYSDFRNKEIQADMKAEADRAEGIWKSYDLLQEAEDERQRAFHENTRSWMETLEDNAKRNTDIGRELGLTFSSAFEDAVVKGNSFRDVLKGVEMDIARIIARKAITTPLADGISEAFKGSGGFSGIFDKLFGGSAGSAGSWTSGGDLALGNYATGTDFVPQTGLYRLHRGEKVTPADQNGGGTTVVNNWNIQTIDGRSAAAFIHANKDAIGGVINQAFLRGGRRSGMTL